MTIEERRKLQEAIRHNRIKKSSDTASENKTTDKYSGLREAVRNGRIKTQPSSAPSTEALQTVEPLSVEEKEDIKAGAIRPLSVNLTEEQKAEVQKKQQAREKEKVDAARVRIADPNADKKSEQYIKDKTLVIGYDALNNEAYKNAKASPALTFEIFGGPTYEAVKLYNSLGSDDEHVDNQILKSDAYYLTPEQRQVVRILGNNRKWDDLEEYLKGVKPEAEQKHNEAINRDVKQFVKELPPVLDAAVDTGIGIASMATSLATIPQNVKSWITGGEIDLNDGANLITTMAKASGEAMSEKINNETIGFLYEVGQSIVEMGASIAAGNAVGAATGLVSLASKIPLTLMSASAAAQAVSDATERGLDSTQAIALGSVSAAASWLLEKVPLDNLLNVKNLNISSIKEILKNTAKQAGIEGFEEAGEEAINMIADEIITAYNGKSNVEIEVEKMVESGVPENTAYAKVIVGNLLQSAAGGALAGGFMGGVANTGRYIGIKSSEKKLDKTLKKAASEGNKEVAIDALDESIKADIDTKNAIRNTKQIEKAEKVEIIDKLNADIKRKTTLKDTLRNADWSDKESINKILNIRPETGEESRIDDLEKNEAAEAEAEMEAEATRKAAVNATAQNEAVATESTPTEENAVESDSESVGEGKEITLEEASGKYGAEAATMRNAYAPEQNVAQYDKAYKMAYDMGMSGVPIAEALNDKATSYLTETQRRNAYEAGQRVSESRANEQDTLNKNAANRNTVRRRGTVSMEGVSISEMQKTFNDPQNKAYNILKTLADVTGIDIVLTKSDNNAKGEYTEPQGKFAEKDNTMYIDLTAGLYDVSDVEELSKYSMLRTFSHEFTHFLEKWNPLMYNEFRKTVFAELEARGENVHDLIELKKADGMEYEEASREVVAEAMTDILPEASFVETLAQKHKNIFETLLARLKEFVSEIKAYFNSLEKNPSREANALKEQIGDTVRYAENIVKMFDEVAVQAVENYQATVATEENTNKGTESNTEGDIINGKEETNGFDRGAESGTSESQIRTRTENEDRSEIQEGLRKENEVNQQISQRQHRGLKDKTWLLDSANYIIPERGSLLNEAQNILSEEYGLESHIIKESAWDIEPPALAYKGKIYLAENISFEDVKHEVTHVMKQVQFKPYLDFVERTPDMLNTKATEYFELMEKLSEHLGFDVFDINENQVHRLYDEFNSAVYGSYMSGEADWLKNAFLDFDSYINELSKIHEEFKKANKAASSAQTAQETVVEVTPESEPFAITENAQYNTLEVKFDEKPSEAVRDILKENKFRWNRTKGVWYGKADRGALTEALNKAYKAEESKPTDFETAFKNATQEERDEVVEAINANTKISHIAPTELRETEPAQQVTVNYESSKKESTEEVNVNGKNADNEGTVQNVIPDRQGDARVLDEVETGDVQGDVRRGDTLGSAVERGQQTVRDDLRSDAAGLGGGSSEGNSESRDLRRDDGLTSEEAAEKAEKLHEEVTEQIQQQSTEQPKGNNFVIGDSLDLPNGEKARYKANVEAIRLVKKLQAENRYATESEQKILSKYVGWGGLANAFDMRKSDWSKEYAELKEVLTDEEYRAARASTLNAHYTDISVIKAMYDGLKGLGFTGGRMLEPSSGTGNFVGAMPSDMSAKVASWTMVELDSITGLIAKYLYPNADIRIQGFETANIPNNYMDVAIGNVPFGHSEVADKTYPKKVTSAIHNYFFAKSLDKVRPGGIVMFITSSYTMNSKDSTVRKYIMDRADLLGAIRLPDTAFKGNAGTEAVTDILILKKRAENTPYSGEKFLEAPFQNIDRYGANINEYFSEHPEMVLGTATMSGGMYRANSLTYKAFEDKGSLADQIREAFTHISGKMEYPVKYSKERTNLAVERAVKRPKENSLISRNGKIYKNEDGHLVEQNVSASNAERITGLLEIRDAAKNLLVYQQQGAEESKIKSERDKLNTLYDAFVKKHGFINSQSNKSVIKDDPDSFSIYALENWDSDKKTATKSDLFTKNTVAPNKTITSVKDVSEGLIVSLNQTGMVDVPLIAKLTGETEESVTIQLIDSRKAFKTRDGLESAEVYLSGNVRAKLRDAESLLPYDKDFANNVEALKLVMPEDVKYQDIYINPGTPWIPSSVYSDFAAYMLGSRNTEWSKSVDVTRNPETGNFTIELKNHWLKTNSHNTQKWGTPRRSFLVLFDAMLNSKSVVVKDKLDDGTTVINKDATAAANEKIENITKEFQEWLWKDEARRTELSTLYNETFNSIVTPKYNGNNLTVNGSNALKPLRPHQRDAVQRVISSGGNTLLAHKVGAGKTYEMAAAAMKLKELGLVKKPMFAVPKSLVAQWGNEFKDFFPTARLLVAEASDFTAANRKVFMNRIANGEYDAVIVSYEQFEKLPMSDSFTKELYQEQIDSIIAAIEEAKAEKGEKALSIKDLEKKRKSLQTKIDKLTDKAKDEGNIDFEQLGVDSLFIDEAHNFKNLFYTTAMTNVAGLGNKDGSKRAFDLYTKVRYLQKLNGGKGIVFATATPVMNSMSEMYIMQKYLQPDLLEQLGLSTFDAWAKQFGEVVNGVEIKPSGQGYRVKQSFSRFKNMSELQLLFRNFADVLTDIPGLKIPKMKGGKVNVVVCEPGEFQQNYMKELEKRADNVKNVDPSVDNMLKITSDGRKISYTQRMIDPSLPYEEGCKIFRCADNVVKAYKESDSIKGTQLIFCDMATPKGKSKAAETEVDEVETDMESAKLYDDIKSRLVKNGIPAKEIAFIHEADTDQKKKKLFADVNEGKVRVLIGSTGKMGVGMNAQKRVVAIHHLDAPWRPGDVEQRNGRAYRQGNINDEVECFTYVTEGSFDARLWDILERKQNFIDQIMNGENVGREVEDTGEVTLSAAEVKALASGSPLILEQVQLDTDIKKLESLERAHRTSVSNAKNKYELDKGRIATLERSIKTGSEDIKNTIDTYSEGKFSITVGKKKYVDKREAGIALMAAATAKANENSYTDIGSFAGFDLSVIKTPEGIKGLLGGSQGYAFNTYPGNTTYMINHLISTVEGIREKVETWKKALQETKNDIAEQEKLISEPFAKQTELEQKRKRYREVMDILNPKEEQVLDISENEDDNVQYQARKYLESDDYPTDGVHWGIEEGVMSEVDARTVWEAIADIRKRKYRTHQTTVNGEHYIESTNLLMIVNTDYKKPIIKTIFAFNDSNESNMSYAKRRLKDARGIQSRLQEAWDVIEVLYGKGYITRYDIEDSRTYARQNAAREGTNSRETSGEPKVKSWHFGDDQNQNRRKTLTDREVLKEAAEELRKISDEVDKGVRKIGKLTDEELEVLNEIEDKLDRRTTEWLEVENKDVLKSLLQKARKVVETRQREYDAEKLRRYREHRDNAETIRKVKAKLNSDVKEMIGWITHPNSKDIKKHIPDSLKDVVKPFLESIDFSSKTKLEKGENTAADKRFYKRMENLQKVLENYAAGKDIDGSGILADMVLPEDFLADLNDQLETIRKIIEAKSGRFVINEMTAEELKNLHKVVKILKNSIKNVNTFYNQGVFKHVSDAGDSGIEYMNELSDHSNKWIDRAWDKIWAHLKPYEGFKLFGESGKAIFKTLQKAQAKLAFNEKAIESFVKETYKLEEVKAWEKQVITSKMSGKEVKATVAQVMGLYELSKDPEGKKHILNGGIRFSYSKPKTSLFDHDHGLELSEDHGHILTEEELNEMTSKLTERQKEVADKIQQFLSKDCGRLGNEVSVIRFGERLFNNPFYYPISVDKRKLSADKANEETNKNASLYALLNMGFTKQREGSKKRVVVYSIFDVLAGHSSDMARYNAFALPLIDTIKWLNYKQVEIDENGRKIERDSIRDQMARVYGAPPTEGNKQTVGYAENFVTSIIKAMNGTESQGSKFDSFGTRTLHRYNVAQVAYNLSTAIQQPLSMIRAAMVLSPESIIGNPFNAKEVKENKEEMLKYSGIAVWKSLGFYDVNISRGVSELIKNDRTKLDKFIDAGMKGAEFMDTWTWASIWGACKKEVTKKQKLNEGSPEFYKAVTDLFEEVVYSTQVVDSVFTKTEYMRNQSAIPRILSSFMSEPVTTANMVFSALNKVKTDEQHGMSWKEAVKKNADTISRTIAVYSVAAILNAAVQAARDALRDDDEYETFPQKAAEAFWSNFIDEIIPFNKLPILSNFWEFGKMTLSKFGVDTYGYAPQSVILQGYDQAGKAIEILFDKDSKYTLTGKAYKLLQAASSISGLPMSNIMREVVTIHNNTIGLLDNEYIKHYYDKGDKNYIKNAYLEGNISEEEAVQELISLGLAEDENEAYWMLQESSKYAKLLDAAFNGKSIEKASEELIAHGVTKKEIHSRIKSAVKQRFKDGRITEEEAVAVLQKYLEIPSYSAMVMLQNWDD